MNQKGNGCVLLFVKYPHYGQVKTRLAAELGLELAAKLYKKFVSDILKTLKDLPHELRIFFDPPHSEENFKTWLGTSYNYVPQRGDDLGEKMKNAFQRVFAEGFSKAVVIGSDAPDLPADFIESAMRALDSYDSVVGPSEDGGYYLLGFSKESFLQDVFEGIVWSSSEVCSQTLTILKQHFKKVYMLPRWCDIDTLPDLMSLALRNRHTAFCNSDTMQFLSKNRIISEVDYPMGGTENVRL